MNSFEQMIPYMYEDNEWRLLNAYDLKNLQISIKSEVVNYCKTIKLQQISIKVTPVIPVEISALKFVYTMPKGLECTHMPHLSPLETMTTGEKEFRSPAIIFEGDQEGIALIPNIDEMKERHPIPYIMDYDINSRELYYGVGNQIETGHVYYMLTGEKTLITEEINFSFYIAISENTATNKKRDFKWVENVLWELFGEKEMVLDKDTLYPQGMKKYVDYVYDWAFKRWGSLCWQEFELNGKQVGGVVFIVTANQKPGHGKEDIWREPKSIWNQAWFSSLRSAYGYYRWGERTNNDDWMQRGEKALAFALSAPQTNGLFPGYYIADENNSLANGHWVNSPPRRPNGLEEHVHLLDSSWTCYWLLKWYQDIKDDEEILKYVNMYVSTLVGMQKQDGSFPAWVVPETLEQSEYLVKSPESAAHVMLLCELYKITGCSEYIDVAEKTATFLTKEIISQGRWEDFETYWSCSREWEGKQYAVRDKRSGLYNTCNFGMYWCAQGFIALHEITNKDTYLDVGEQVLAEISLYQQLNRPNSFPVETVGGFGVLNSDNEWNDARQSLFALTYLQYYKNTKNKKYLCRALYAMKASFYMMYCPENSLVKPLYEKVHQHFDEMDYGFHMENFNHSDGTAVNGIGEFTIFDWGNGAACSSLIEYINEYEKLN